MLVMTGLHGNEASGIQAARRMLDRFESNGVALRGDLVVLAGNLQALAERTRFIDKDLNRQWTPEKVAAASAQREVPDEPAENREQVELLRLFAEFTGAARGQVYFIDLHTSSAEGAPFVTVGDTLRNRRFAMGIPLPLILGLEEQVDGSLLEYLNNRGYITMGVEAGQHEEPAAVERHEAVLLHALVNIGMLPAEDVPELPQLRRRLEEASRGVPRVLEVRHRHAIEDGDGFEMEPGYATFRVIEKGEMLARDRRGPVEAPESGRVLLPLYQGKGDDGFFIGREFNVFWLSVSAILRRLRLAALIPRLPGARRHPEREEVLVINTRVARWYPLEILHLLGFRKLRRVGNVLLVSRRLYDLAPPSHFRQTRS